MDLSIFIFIPYINVWIMWISFIKSFNSRQVIINIHDLWSINSGSQWHALRWSWKFFMLHLIWTFVCMTVALTFNSNSCHAIINWPQVLPYSSSVFFFCMLLSNFRSFFKRPEKNTLCAVIEFSVLNLWVFEGERKEEEILL